MAVSILQQLPPLPCGQAVQAEEPTTSLYVLSGHIVHVLELGGMYIIGYVQPLVWWCTAAAVFGTVIAHAILLRAFEFACGTLLTVRI